MFKFTECLNDGWDYFFLVDPLTLSTFKSDNELPDDLIEEFTTKDSGDVVVKEGALIALSGIANYPYHIYFQLNNLDSVFDSRESDLQFKKNGYILEVRSEKVFLLTLPYLKNWTEHSSEILQKNHIRPNLKLENGFYSVEIKGGETLQESGWEPTIEFRLNKEVPTPLFKVDDMYFRFCVKSKEY